MKFSTPVGFRSMMCRCSLSCFVCMNVHVGVCNSCEVIFILYQNTIWSQQYDCWCLIALSVINGLVVQCMVLMLLLTLKGLLQQLLECWKRFSVSDVINFRLESVTITKWFLLRSSCPGRVYDDYYFYVSLYGCLDQRSFNVGVRLTYLDI